VAVAVAVVAVVPAIRVRETPPRGGVLHVLVLCGKRYGACPLIPAEGPERERNERVKFAGSGFTRSGGGKRRRRTCATLTSRPARIAAAWSHAQHHGGVVKYMSAATCNVCRREDIVIASFWSST